MEAICKVVKLNGESIPADCHLVMANFTSGGEVVTRFKNRDYCGVINLACDEESVAKREDSHSDHTSRRKRFTPSPLPSTADGRSRKRKCVECNDIDTGLAAKWSMSVDDPRPRSLNNKSVTERKPRHVTMHLLRM